MNISAKPSRGLGDIGVGLMAWLNIIAILLLTKIGLATLKDYEAQRKSGKALCFEPRKLEIKGAELWDSILCRLKSEEGKKS